MASPRIQFRPGEGLANKLIERTQLSPDTPDGARDVFLAEAVRQTLEDYYNLLERSVPTFEMKEAMLIMDALNGIILMSQVPHLLWAEVSDAIQMDGLDKKWDVDGEALVKRLRGMTAFEQWAIADAVSRAWNAPTYRIDNMEERIRKVGLVK